MARNNLEGLYNLISDKKFGERVAMAFYQIGREVLNEPTNIDGHERRAQFARSVFLQSAEDFIPYGAMAISDPIIVELGTTKQSDIPDEHIISAVENMWNTLSGVNT